MYEISSLGRLKSLMRKGRTSDKILKPRLQNNGYHKYCLQHAGKYVHRLVHRLTYETFIGPIQDGMQINHVNGIKTDNRPENLEMVTASANQLHSYRVLGNKTRQGVKNKPGARCRKGSTHQNSKLTEADILEMFSLRALGLNCTELGSKFAVHPKTVSAILNKRLWKHVTL